MNTKHNSQTNDDIKGNSDVEECTPLLKIAKTRHLTHMRELYPDNNINPMISNACNDFSESHVIDYVPLYQISGSSKITTEVNIDMKVAGDSGIHFVPPSRFFLQKVEGISKHISISIHVYNL